MDFLRCGDVGLGGVQKKVSGFRWQVEGSNE